MLIINNRHTALLVTNVLTLGYVEPINRILAIGASPSDGACRAPIADIFSHVTNYEVKRGSVDLARWRCGCLAWLYLIYF